MDTAPHLSVVVPIYREEQILAKLLERSFSALDRLGCSYELIIVDDGSDDGTAQILDEALDAGKPLRVIKLSRNFGLQNAVTAGLAHARGEIIGLMDGDLQDPPELFAEMIARLGEGHDVVYMLKRSREETSWLRRVGFSLFYWIFRRVSQTPLPPSAGLFSLMRRHVVRAILDCTEHRKFVPGLRAWVGYQQTGIPFDRHAREGGDPRQSFGRLLRLATDAIYSFTDLPLKLALVLGIGTGFLGLLGVLVVSGLRIFTDLAISGWASTLVSIFFMGGIQLICVGILGEYISRIYDEVRRRPQYIVEEIREASPRGSPGPSASPGVALPETTPSTPSTADPALDT